MHILLGIFGIVAAAAWWWYRARHIAEAGKDASRTLKAAGRKWRADQLAHPASVAPVLKVGDPLTAAAIVVLSIVCEGGEVSRRAENRLRELLLELGPPDRVESAIAEANRIQGGTSRTADVVDLLGDRLREWLEPLERSRLLEIIRDVAQVSARRPAHISNHIVRLRERLGVE